MRIRCACFRDWHNLSSRLIECHGTELGCRRRAAFHSINLEISCFYLGPRRYKGCDSTLVAKRIIPTIVNDAASDDSVTVAGL
jgi:hypothetical protein